MGNIKDLVYLVTQLTNSVKDRKLATELNAIQSLVAQIQSEQATLHEANMELREECLSSKQRIQELEAEIASLRSAPIAGPSGVPTCPNCSTVLKPFYMSPMERDFFAITGLTHQCMKCNYQTKV